MSEKHSVTKSIISMTREALKEVGEEEFDERGPDEIMDLGPITQRYRQLSQKTKVLVSSELKEYNRCSETLAHILMTIEHDFMMEDLVWDKDELREILDAGHPTLRDNFSDIDAEYQGS